MNEMVRLRGTAIVRSAASGALRTFGIVRMGNLLVALDCDEIQEVVPAPSAFLPAGSAVKEVVGLFLLRGLIVPVADLRARLGQPPAGLSDVADGVVLVLRVAGRLLGLLADAVQGIVPEVPDGVHELTLADIGSGKPLFSHAIRLGEVSALLLVAARVLSLPDMPSVVAPPGAVSQAGMGTGARAEAEGATLLFTCGDLSFGIPAGAVEATAPDASIEASPLASDLCLGVIDHHGAKVPVLDTLRVLGLGALQARTHVSTLIVRFPEDMLVGFVLDAVVDIVRTDPAVVMTMPPSLVRACPLVSRSYCPDGAAVFLLLDHADMIAQESLKMFARLCQPARIATSTNDARAALDLHPHLVFRAGGELAAPVADLFEIIAMPETYIPLQGDRQGAGDFPIIGAFAHRGLMIPLVPLGLCIGSSTDAPTCESRVLLVSHEGLMCGFVVDGLTVIAMAGRRPGRFGVTGGNRESRFPLVETQDGRLLPSVRLGDLAARIAHGEPGSPMASPDRP